MKIKLNACQWCNGDITLTYEENRMYKYHCSACGTDTYRIDISFERAIEQWNSLGEKLKEYISPCEIGEIVYVDTSCIYIPYWNFDFKKPPCIEGEVVAVKRTKQKKLFLVKPFLEECCNSRGSYTWFAFSSVGKTVFYTKKEAIEKLTT